ncbi:MAG: Re/Si-specific NAD(P)(+) transhydrogenase subunit alpha [Acidobacteria bacterium]|nr:Re/Si-specific NAD(P)(+) transhydrogenase subunit alpha [Acidobacteriota bacterium]
MSLQVSNDKGGAAKVALTVGVLKETSPGERRVAMTPKGVELLTRLGAEVWVERGAGVEAGFTDAEYEAKKVQWASSAEEVRQNAQVLLAVQVPEPHGLSSRHTVVGFCDPLSEPHRAAAIAETGATLFSIELLPRITRAQSMDALSSMATVSGYKAVMLAANTLPRMFPMMMTAAGTIPPARVLVIGVGVAGLQAIATARRLGAVVTGYDVRSTVKEQIESLGAKFLSIRMDGAKAEGEGGYARQLSEEDYRRQREQMAEAIAEQDVVITTAAVPGKRAPRLVTAEMVRRMSPGSVIVDLAAERGGNCELTRPGETVVENGVQILGPLNVPSGIPYHASQMYARNLAEFLKNIVKNNELCIDKLDDIVRETLLTEGGKVVHPKVQALLDAVVRA